MHRGFALIAATIITAIFLTIGAYAASLSLTDLRISRAHAATIRAYYISEAGSALLLREIQDNATLADALRAGTLSLQNSQRTYQNFFGADSATVYAISSAPGEATLFTVSQQQVGTVTAKRRTENQISQALGSSVTDYSILLGGNNQDLLLALDAQITGGVVFSNDDIDVKNGATVSVRGNVWAHDKVRIDNGSRLNVTGRVREERPAIAMPAVDFDSADPNSWRRRATQVMTPSEFNRLPNGTTLSGIIFVNGSPADLRKDLNVVGILVINGSFEIEQPAHLRITRNGTGPSGLLVRNSLEIENSTYIEGLLYASNYLEVEYDDDDTASTLDFSLRGGLIARRAVFRRDKAGAVAITINHDEELIGQVLRSDLNITTPLIDIGHWEEQY